MPYLSVRPRVPPPRILAAGLALGLVLLALQMTQTDRPAFALSNCSVSDSFDSQERAFLDLINQYRARNGLPQLTASVNLNRASAWMAQDMAEKNYFSHTDSAGRSVSQRVSDCGGSPYNGENIAAGTYRDTAQEAFDAWRNSSGHNANMLRSSYRQIGVARYHDSSSRYSWYWVTDFSTSNDGTNAASGSTGSTGTSGSSGGTSGGTTSPPPPPPASETDAARITSPANGSTLGYSTVFDWSGVSGAQGYMLYVGTSKGSNNMLSVWLGTRTSVRVTGFPSTGSTVYVRLWTKFASGWQYNDYTYRLP